MLTFLTKNSYWAALETEHVADRLAQTNRAMICMKHAQDAFMLKQIGQSEHKRIIEIGGGWGRILRTLDPSNERWNLERSEGQGRIGGSVANAMPKEFRLVQSHLGEFSSELPGEYFDIVFSISVMEHIPAEAIPAYWKDHARIMRPGGVAYHAVDFYLGDEPISVNETRIDSYLQGIADNGFEFIAAPALERPAVFRSRYASAPDLTMLHMNKISPRLANTRHNRQNVSLVIGVKRP